MSMSLMGERMWSNIKEINMTLASDLGEDRDKSVIRQEVLLQRAAAGLQT